MTIPVTPETRERIKPLVKTAALALYALHDAVRVEGVSSDGARLVVLGLLDEVLAGMRDRERAGARSPACAPCHQDDAESDPPG